MKHHQWARGWWASNEHDVPIWKEFVALGLCYAAVIGAMFVVVEWLCK